MDTPRPEVIDSSYMISNSFTTRDPRYDGLNRAQRRQAASSERRAARHGRI